MNDRKNSASKALGFTAIAITAVLVMGAAAALVPLPSATETEVPVASTATPSESVAYLPAQFVNQAKEVEPVYDTYTND